MSSYSEYLGRMKQRIPQYIDTRPHRDACHHTEVIKRMAAAGNLETRVAATVCSSTTNNLQETSYKHGGGHRVQDTSDVLSYMSGQAVAEGALAMNAKASQIQATCYAPLELNDKIAADPQLGLIYAARRVLNGCCQTCKKVVQANRCACVGFKHIPV